MDSAALVPSSLEGACDRGDQPGVLVGDDEPDPGQAAALEVGEELAPEHLILAVTHIHTEDLAAALSGHTGGDHDRFGGDQAAAANVEWK